MPFDPQLIHTDEPPLAANGDLSLPPDLAALAEQLRDDSTHLAALYSSIANTQTRSVSERRGRHHVQRRRTAALIASAITASLTALLAGFVVYWQGPQPNPRIHIAAPSTPSQYITTTAQDGSSISLTEFSSPEMEAILDLIERSPDNALRVSF